MTIPNASSTSAGIDRDQLLQLHPSQGLRGRVRVPGDKSISHRALLFGAIAQGETRIEGLLPAEDPLSTAACLRAMGVAVTPIVSGEPVLVTGLGLDGLQEPENVLDCGNSGTTMRLLLGLLSGRAGRHFVLNGDASLRRRPMRRVAEPLARMGAMISGRANGNQAPLATPCSARFSAASCPLTVSPVTASMRLIPKRLERSASSCLRSRL